MCVCDSEPDSLELQEAISKGSFQHDVTNLEPATTYSLYLKAYSPMGASQQSSTVLATTLGGGKNMKHCRGNGESIYVCVFTVILDIRTHGEVMLNLWELNNIKRISEDTQQFCLVVVCLIYQLVSHCSPLSVSPSSTKPSHLLHQGGELHQCAGSMGAPQ